MVQAHGAGQDQFIRARIARLEGKVRNRQMTLIDLGLDRSFDASMTFVQSTLQNINAGWDEPIADINFIRSRDPKTVSMALLGACDVLHVMAHGESSAGPSFTSEDGKSILELADLAESAQESGDGIMAHTVLADACHTGTGIWQRAVRDCLEHDITYIGTARDIYWHDSTVFCSAFYGALFRN